MERAVVDDLLIPETDRLAIIRARKGQGLFKERVGRIESKCRITGVENPVHLVANHCSRGETPPTKSDSTVKMDCS